MEMISRELGRAIWGFNGARTRPSLGRRPFVVSSWSVLRTGTIYGGPETFRELSFAACP